MSNRSGSPKDRPTSADVAIIGAGPAGLTAAYQLTQQGYRVTVIEKDPVYVGGISRTVEHEGFRFDIGGHRFFSKSREVVERDPSRRFYRAPADEPHLL
jgi:phytoene dehydrogenase-like protein